MKLKPGTRVRLPVATVYKAASDEYGPGKVWISIPGVAFNVVIRANVLRPTSKPSQSQQKRKAKR